MNILDTVAATISKYKLLEPGQVTGVALSGGKDSLFTMLVLRELGYSVMLLIVDMGYEKNWDKRIIALAHDMGFQNPKVLHTTGMINNLKNHALNKLQLNRKILDNSELFINKNITPCTFCYNTKAILLENFAIRNSINTIAFGHHSIDSIASMLKSAFMYVDRWDKKNETFSHSRFSELIDEVVPQLTQAYKQAIESPIFKRIFNLCHAFQAGTDEPPFQLLNTSSENIKLVRPLFNVRESTIMKYVHENNIKTETSGCGHGGTKETQTPREMIHYRILRLIDQTTDDRHKLISNFMELI